MRNLVIVEDGSDTDDEAPPLEEKPGDEATPQLVELFLDEPDEARPLV